jgi:hypothetical protein
MMMPQVMTLQLFYFYFWRLSCLLNKDYYKFMPIDFHVIGFDGAGTILEVRA